VLLFVVLGLAASVVYLRLAPVAYTARADVYVSTVGGLNVSELNAGSNFAEQQAKNLSLIATRERVLQPVIRQLRLTDSAADLGDEMTATVPTNTSMILLEVSSSSPRQAAQIANAVSSSLVNITADLLPPAKKGAPAIRVQIVQPAVVPTSPSQPSFLVATLVGLAAGLLVGLAVALALEGRRERRAAAQPAAAPQTARPASQPSSKPVPARAPVRQEQPTPQWSWGSENS